MGLAAGAGLGLEGAGEEGLAGAAEGLTGAAEGAGLGTGVPPPCLGASEGEGLAGMMVGLGEAATGLGWLKTENGVTCC